MNTNEIEWAAHIFRYHASGIPITDRERAFLQGLLDTMEAPERAGAIAKIIEIMLEGK